MYSLCFLSDLLRFWFGWISKATAAVGAQDGVASGCGWSLLPAAAEIVPSFLIVPLTVLGHSPVNCCRKYPLKELSLELGS